MKYAVISDIHGNYPALCAVLNDAAQAGVDQYIFAGDYATAVPYPNEVVETIRKMPCSHIIRGNGEDHLDSISGKDEALWTDGQYSLLYWSYRALTDENRQYLMHLPKRLHITDGNVELFAAHSWRDFIGTSEKRFSSSQTALRYAGKPFSREILLDDIQTALSENSEFQKTLSALSDGVYIFGHTHIQWHARFKNKILINAGSCGEALDFSKTGAAYTILSIEGDIIDIDERQVFYDRDALVQSIRSSSLYPQAPFGVS